MFINKRFVYQKCAYLKTKSYYDVNPSAYVLCEDKYIDRFSSLY